MREFSFEPVTLAGRAVRLEALAPEHASDLFALAEPEVWRWLSTPLPRDEEQMRAWIDAALHDGTVAWVVLADGEVAGSTSYLDVRPAHAHVEIGRTWLGRRWWRTAVNTECKLLLLGHAFDTLGTERVTIKTDIGNTRSQAAIERLGAVREGVLRHDRRRPDGSWRDGVYYSVLREEWPTVRDRLRARLDRGGRAAAAPATAP